MDMAKHLRQRFVDAIGKAFQPCPLIGEGWFRYHPEGKPADFEFLGIAKLAKATGRTPANVVRKLLRSLSFGKVKADVKVTRANHIHVVLKKPAQPEDAEKAEKADKPQKAEGGS